MCIFQGEFFSPHWNFFQSTVRQSMFAVGNLFYLFTIYIQIEQSIVLFICSFDHTLLHKSQWVGWFVSYTTLFYIYIQLKVNALCLCNSLNLKHYTIQPKDIFIRMRTDASSPFNLHHRVRAMGVRSHPQAIRCQLQHCE